MTSTNSSNNFLAALKNNFRQYAALFAVFQIFALLLSVLLINFNADYFDGRNQLTNNITEIFSNMCIPLFVCFFSVEAFILAAVLFRGIYSKRASDFYFSLPVKRGSWFNANFLFGVISMALSYAMFYIISMITVNFGSFKAFRFVNLEAGSFLKFTLMSFAAVAVLYTVFVMCAVIAGRIWQYVFLSFISTLVLYIGAIGFICYLNTIYGFWLNLETSYSIAAVKLVISDVTDFSVLKFAIAAVAQFAVFYTAGYVAFKKRKAEVAENRLSGKVLPVALTVICFLAETFVCLGIGNEVSLFARILAAIIIAAVTAVVLSAVFFRKAMSKPVFASLCCAIMFSAATILSVQLISEKIYVNVVPETDEIESVTVRSYSNDGSTSVIDILCGYSYIELSDSFEKNISFNRDEYKFSTEEAKEKTVQFQQKILSDETRDNIYSEEYYNGSVSFSCL
ncbi:MAG: hypothetical protein K2I14_00730 [Eubacterium sp.]|nr:hypothetical protein [Eubacterium sp.]